MTISTPTPSNLYVNGETDALPSAAVLASLGCGNPTALAELKAETAPGAIARRGGRAVTGWFTDEFGGIRPERVAIVGAVVVAIIALKVLRRGRR